MKIGLMISLLVFTISVILHPAEIAENFTYTKKALYLLSEKGGNLVIDNILNYIEKQIRKAINKQPQ